MKLDDLLLTVESSSHDEWHKMDHFTLHGWESGERAVSGQQHPYLEPKWHHKLAILKSDIDVSIAFGADVVEDFGETWTANFPNPKASSILVVLRYKGAVVYEWTFVVVDGGRYLLPLPELNNGQYEVTTASLPFARLMFGLYGQGGLHTALENALTRAGINIV